MSILCSTGARALEMAFAITSSFMCFITEMIGTPLDFSVRAYPPLESERKNEQAKPNQYKSRDKNLRPRKKFFTFLKKIADFAKIAQKNSYTYKVLPIDF